MSSYDFFATVERDFGRLVPARFRLLMLFTSEFFFAEVFFAVFFFAAMVSPRLPSPPLAAAVPTAVRDGAHLANSPSRMPEGPETRRVALRLSRALVGKPLTEVRIDFPGLEEAGRALTGSSVVSVTSRGKALLTAFSSGQVLYTHNLLYGRWSVARRALPVTRRRLRVLLRTADVAALLHSATEIALVEGDALGSVPYLARIGPDVIDLPAEDLRARLRDRAWSGRQLGALLLDQSFVAGIGNYLRAEALFLARLSPAKRPRDLSALQIRTLAKTSHELANLAVKTAGITLPPGLAARAKAAGERRRETRHYVYGRGGLPCFRCGARIVRADIGGRHLYACPGCQGWPDLS
jgi:endonuclease-8